jgi:uncharacterized zinc-type alcohol dehydrogenase-like protein
LLTNKGGKMTKIKAYAAIAADKPLQPYEFERRNLRPYDIEFDILYCGVCHSDIHQARNEWGSSVYPMVPGHEIVGRVTRVGQNVTKFKPGDIAGIGCMVDSCRQCDACAAGIEQYCERGSTMTYNDIDKIDGQAIHGGYSQMEIVNEDFALHIPDSIDPAKAAPLLCAGITTFSPLRHWRIGQGHKVGIIGIGGLGHMAVQYAKSFGAETYMITTTPTKVEDAKSLGADGVIIATDETDMQAGVNSFDFLLDTIPESHNLQSYLNLLKRNGVMIIVGALQPIEPGINGWQLAARRLSIGGSMIGGIAETREMLEYSAAHNIVPDIKLIKIEDINQAYESIVNKEIRYRYVIDMKASFQN